MELTHHQAFSRVDLSPDRVDNVQMGYVFEELIRIGAEQANEEAGEHFTPREVIRLMVNLPPQVSMPSAIPVSSITAIPDLAESRQVRNARNRRRRNRFLFFLWIKDIPLITHLRCHQLPSMPLDSFFSLTPLANRATV